MKSKEGDQLPEWFESPLNNRKHENNTWNAITSLPRPGWNRTKPLLLITNPYPLTPTLKLKKPLALISCSKGTELTFSMRWLWENKKNNFRSLRFVSNLTGHGYAKYTCMREIWRPREERSSREASPPNFPQSPDCSPGSLPVLLLFSRLFFFFTPSKQWKPFYSVFPSYTA